MSKLRIAIATLRAKLHKQSSNTITLKSWYSAPEKAE